MPENLRYIGEAAPTQGVNAVTPLGTLLVCLIAAAGVGLLRFAANASGTRPRGAAQTTARTPVRGLPKRPGVEPALERPALRRAS